MAGGNTDQPQLDLRYPRLGSGLPAPNAEYVHDTENIRLLSSLVNIHFQMLSVPAHKIQSSPPSTSEPLTYSAGHSQNELNFTVACWSSLAPSRRL